MDRINILLDFLKEEPSDPFNYYALAIEYQKTNQRKALDYFDQLLSDFPDYLATYYTVGKFFEEDIEDYARALDVYRKGILLAKKQQVAKAEKELQTALTNLEFELD